MSQFAVKLVGPTNVYKSHLAQMRLELFGSDFRDLVDDLGAEYFFLACHINILYYHNMKSQVGTKPLSELKRRSEDVAALLKQLSHPQRLLILCSMAEGEKSVGEIEDICGASQSAVSQFLKGMRLEGLIESRREGKQVYYKIVDKRVLDLIKSLYQIFCR